MDKKCQNIQARQFGIGNDRYDESLAPLVGLLEQGFDTIKWIVNDPIDSAEICKSLDGMTWSLEEFLATTEYDAPIYSKSHPNCLCTMEVTHPNGAVFYVNYSGII